MDSVGSIANSNVISLYGDLLRLLCDYFEMYTNIEFLCWTPGTNTVSQVSYTAKTSKLTEGEVRFAVPRRAVGEWQHDNGDQKAQTSSYKISPGDVKYSTGTIANNPTLLSQRCKHTAYLKVAKEDLKSSRHKKKKLYLHKVTTVTST